MSLQINREALAWAAGFFDGEGYVGASVYGTRREMTIAIPQIDRRVLDRFKTIVGVGKVYGPYVGARAARPGAQPQWRYRVGGHENIQAICALLWTWLGPVKREQFAKTLMAWPLRAHNKYRRNPCQHGIWPRTLCVDCKREYHRAYHLKYHAIPANKVRQNERSRANMRTRRAALKLVATQGA